MSLLIVAAASLATFTQALALTKDEQAALNRAASRGEEIYQYDRAAWITTDVLRSKVPDPRALGKTGGWIVEPKGDRLHVVYYADGPDGPREVFWADAKDGAVVESHLTSPDEDARLSADERRMAQARLAASKDQSKRPCTSGPFNTVVLPSETPNGPMPVYLLSAQVRRNEYPMGGHYELDVGSDGKVVFSRAFTRACLNIPSPDEARGEPAAMVVSHLLDPVPTEIHVFISLSARMPIYVITSGERLWKVDGARIELIDTSAIDTKP